MRSASGILTLLAASSSSPLQEGDGRRIWRMPRAALFAVLSILCSALYSGAAFAQPASPAGIVTDGDAAVTGFSGSQPPALIAPGIDPANKTYIDLTGPSLRVIDLDAPGAPPQAQLIQATKPFTATASQTGQVFAVALDNAIPPNIYVAATSVYGLPIVVPDQDGDGLPDRVKQGAPNASFMLGLFGPSGQGGGPGSIWRIDGVTGEVRLFANVTLNGVPNSGPALGGLAYDPLSNSLFVADRDTGMIHRFDLNGTERGTYDHGVQGRQAAGLPPVPFDPAKRLNIASPQFDTTNPATWGYAPAPRRIFGLAARGGRLYYAVAEGLQIWSVAIATDGAFGTDARLEITVPPNVAATEISKITFYDQGRMLLAERAAPTGAYDFAVLAQEGIGRVLRYSPTAPAAPGAPGWQPVPDQYAIGFPLQMRNGNGGVAVGYGYDAQGRIDRGSCGGFLWSTGEQLRVSPDPALAAKLAQGGPAIVNGLQGNDINLVVPANVPPLKTYFIDYDDRFDDPEARGHLGDIAIWRLCSRVGLPWFGGLGVPGVPVPLPPLPPFCPLPGPNGCICPPGDPACVCPPGTAQQPGLQCCPNGMVPGPGGCQSLCANPANDPIACFYGFNPSTGLCWNNTPPGAGGLCPMPANAQCPAGYTMIAGLAGTWSDATCAPTPQQQLCMGGQVGLDNQCHQLCPPGSTAWPIQQCCPIGTVPNAFGQCMACPAGQLTAGGICCPAGQQPGGPGNLQCVCPGGLPPNPVTGLCLPVVPLVAPIKLCPDGKMPDPSGKCPSPPPAPPPPIKPPPFDDPVACAPGYVKMPGGQCCLRSQATTGGQCCPLGQAPDANRRTCVAVTPPRPFCPRGFTLLKDGCCLSSQVTTAGRCCPAGQAPDASGRTCAAVTPPPPVCTRGYTLLGNQCCLNSQVAGNQCCPAGQRPDARRQSCVPVGGTPPVTPAPPLAACPTGSVLLKSGCCPVSQATAIGQCCPPGQRPDASGRSCVSITPPPPRCPGGATPDRFGNCPPLARVCPSGEHWDGRRCVPNVRQCPSGQQWDGRRCVPSTPQRTCPEGQRWDGQRCVPTTPQRTCPTGQRWDGQRCVPTTPQRTCPTGQRWDGQRCVPTTPQRTCPTGQRWDGQRCVPSARR